LLDKRFCDLRLSLASSPLEHSVRRLYGELSRKGNPLPAAFLAVGGMVFRPTGFPGIANPFLPRASATDALERRFMHEVEGGNDKWLMRILRHETGHAIDTAFGLRRRKAWRDAFGKASRRYPSRYSPRPAAGTSCFTLALVRTEPSHGGLRRDLRGLVATAFGWRSHYSGWPALAKLEYVDETIRGLEGRRAIRLSRDTVEPLSRNERTLREHYRRKQARYEVDLARSYDRRLLRVFGRRDDHPRGLAASRFLREIRPQLRRLLTRRGAHAPIPRQPRAADGHAARAAADLKLKGSQRRAKRDVLAMLERIMLDMLLRDRRTTHYEKQRVLVLGARDPRSAGELRRLTASSRSTSGAPSTTSRRRCARWATR